MKLNIQADRCDRETLRALLIDAADTLAGSGSSLLEATLPWDGHPILLADADAHPVLVSFDLDDNGAALLGGLQASDRLAMALPWLNQVYEALQQQHRPPRLIVVTREPSPGTRAALAGNGSLELFTCQVLRINEDLGVLLEKQCRTPTPGSQADTAGTAPRPAIFAVAPTTAPPVNEADLPPLSEQEAAYFEQL